MVYSEGMKQLTLRISCLLASLLLVLPVHAGLLVLRTASQEGLRAKFDMGNRQRNGICVEIMAALERIDPELRFTGLATTMGTARIEQELQRGSLDVFFGFLKTPEREQRYRFVEPPLFWQSSRLAVRADDRVVVSSFDDIRRLGPAGVILATQGTAHIPFLKAQQGLLIDDGARSSEANLSKLLLGRGRFFYQGDLNLAFDILQYGYGDKVRILPVVFRREAQYAVFGQGVPESAIARVRQGLEQLQRSGELDAIYQRYAPVARSP